MRQRQTQSKGVRNMDDETIAKVDAEMSCGFDSKLQSAAISSAAGAFTFQAETASNDGFMPVLTQAAVASGAIAPLGQPAFASGSAASDGSNAGVTSMGAAGAAPPQSQYASPAKALALAPATVFDIRSSRNALMHDQTKRIVTSEK